MVIGQAQGQLHVLLSQESKVGLTCDSHRGSKYYIHSLIGKLQRKRFLVRMMRRWEDNIKVDIKWLRIGSSGRPSLRHILLAGFGELCQLADVGDAI
jgi:hypothetical protein